MANENLHDIKVDELDSSKKSPIRNILTLLALLFIILVISVVITKLILNTDEGASIENNNSLSALTSSTTDQNSTSNSNDETSKESNNQSSSLKDVSTKDVTPTLSSKIPERNISTPAISSALKVPLTTHEPKEMRVYKEPKKHSTATKETTKTPKKTVSRESTTPKKHVSTPPKKQYADKVIVKKEPVKARSTHTNNSSSKNVSFLGGKRVKVSHSYYIKVGTYRDPSSVLRKIKKNNYNYSTVKLETDKSLTRVLVGPFFSRNQANSQLAKVKARILSGAYVTKVK